ncbi:phospholipase A [Sulfurimonas sp. MAG313]|nr:phospholipase A [Sulfurimonas sp. MAG313]MDF1882084.1 phospholipase A [Sulfurimonas sp. MAG313]
MKNVVFLIIIHSILFADNTSSQMQTDVAREKLAKTFDTIKDEEAKKTMTKKVKGLFGLKPYNDNYFLPLTYTPNAYKSYAPGEEYKHAEAELQISLQYDAFTNLFGLNEIYSFAYTQKSMWQIYAKSAPFRETNYNPEFFITIPIHYENDYFRLKVARFSFAHQSNGQSNIYDNIDINATGANTLNDLKFNRSRSWNYMSAMLIAEHNNVFVGLKGMYRIPEPQEEDDNPNLTQYIGNTELFFLFPYGKSFYKGSLKVSLETGKGSTELSYSYPFAHQENVYFFTKVFTGYGDSLIDYDNYLTKFSIGLSFSR